MFKIKFLDRLSLKKLVLASIIVFFIIYVATYAFIDMYFVDRMVVKENLEALATIQKVQTQYIDKWLDENLNIIIFLSETKSAKDNDIERLLQNSKGFVSINKRFRNISYFDINGQAVFNTQLTDVSKYSAADRDYFQASIKGEPFISGFIKSKINNDLIVIFSSPVYDKNKKVKGVLSGAVSASEILDALKWNELGKSGDTHLLDNNNQLVTTNSSDDTKDIKPLKVLSLYPSYDERSKAGIFINYKGEKVIGVYSRMKSLPGNYSIATEIDYREATYNIREKVIIYFLICALVFLLFSRKMMSMFEKRYFKQLNELVGVVQGFSNDRVYIPAKAEFNNEIGQLAFAFDDMMRSIGEFQTELQGKISELDHEKNVLRESNIKLKLLSGKHEVAMEILNQQNRQLEEANKAKSNFIANVSHELRNPLNVIINYLEYLIEGNEGELNNEQRRSLGISLNNAVRLQDMINDLLNLSTIETGELKYNYNKTSLAKLLDDIYNDKIVEVREKGMELKLEIKAKELEVVTDEAKLRLAIDNIVTNAMKFSEAGAIEITLDKKDDMVEVRIKDEGIGIRIDNLDQIFEPFYQVDSSYKKKYKGVGLGLSISKKIIETLGGQIKVSNNPGKGCTFLITLPIDFSMEEQA